MTEPFFLVWCPTSHRPPTVKHPTSEAASAEAKRLAEANVEQDFHVLQYVGTARAPKSKANYSQAATDEVAVKAPDIPKLKLEVGKFYRTRDGRNIGPMRPYDGVGPYRWIGLDSSDDRHETFTNDGTYLVGDDRSEMQIVAEWVDEPAAEIEKPWVPEGDGWIEHNGSNVNPAPGANVEWIIADERQEKHYIYAFNRSEDVLWSCVVAYRVVEAAKPTRTLKHGEYQVGDRVRYTARASDVGDLSRVGAVGVATDVKSYAVEVKWDDGITRPHGPLTENIEHESLPQFKIGDRVRAKAGGLRGVKQAAGHEAEIVGGSGLLSLRFDCKIKSDTGRSSNTWYAHPGEIELVRPARS